MVVPQGNDDKAARQQASAQHARAREEQERRREELRSAEESWQALRRDVGERYADQTLQTFQTPTVKHREVLAQAKQFAEEMDDRLKRGGGLIFIGPRGTGKDHLAIALLGLACQKLHKTVVRVDGQVLYRKARALIRSTESNAERNFDHAFADPHVLLVSDPAPQGIALNDHKRETLWRIVDRRYSDRRSTWITVNAAGEEQLNQMLTAPIVDRLYDGALVIKTNDLASFRSPEPLTQKGRLHGCNSK